MKKKTRAITFRVPEELHALFKRAERLDIHSRSLSHFASMALEERARRIVDQYDQETKENES